MFSFFKSAGKSARSLTPAEAVAMAGRGELVVIDVREPGEVKASGKARGALHIPLMLLKSRADPRHPEHDERLATDRAVGIYCATGSRSQMAARMLRALGYEEVYNLGSIFDWRAGGGKINR